MPLLPLRPCSYSGCRNLSRECYCPDHKAIHEQEKKDSIKGGYSGKPYGHAWDVLSRRIRHDEPVCRMCKIRAATCTDHIVPKSQCGKDNEENLQPLCNGCHKTKTDSERVRKSHS
jgi:5-methylcytosine-specific restriction protein A